MSNCAPNGTMNGGTLTNTTIVNAEVTGGTITNSDIITSTLDRPEITGNVVLDTAAAESIAEQLCPHVGDCIEVAAEDIARVFKNCDGADHVPNALIPTCTQMNAAIADAVTALNPVPSTDVPTTTQASALPTTIVGTGRAALMGQPDTYFRRQGTDGKYYLIPAYIDPNQED